MASSPQPQYAGWPPRPVEPESALGALGDASAAFGFGQPVRLEPYRGVEHSIGAIKKAVEGPRGAWSPVVRFCVERVCEQIAPKDYLSEALAIRYWVLQHAPYFNDPQNVEWVRDPQTLIETIQQRRIVRCDCDENAALLAAMWLNAGRRVQLLTVGFQMGGPETHVFVRVEIPGGRDRWLVVDPVAGTRETTMLTKVKHFRSHEVG